MVFPFGPRPVRSRFPHPEAASPEGVVAVGAAPLPEVLKDAYAHGIFPWPHDDLPLLWFSPDPRFVLIPAAAHLHRSLKKRMRRGEYEVRADTAFAQVMEQCSRVKRPGQRGTWITEDMIAGYTALHEEGLAHSIEAFKDGELVGGLYGISMGAAFMGESMFALAPDASKVAFATLIGQALAWDFHFIDCQVYTEHLARFGAEEWERSDYLLALEDAKSEETRLGPWELTVTPAEAADLVTAANRELEEMLAADDDADDDGAVDEDDAGEEE